MKKPTTFEEAEAYTEALTAKDGCPFVMGPNFWLSSQLSVAKYYGGCSYKICNSSFNCRPGAF